MSFSGMLPIIDEALNAYIVLFNSKTLYHQLDSLFK